MPGFVIAIVFFVFVIRIILTAVGEIKKAEEAERKRREARARIERSFGGQEQRKVDPPRSPSKPPLPPVRSQGPRSRAPVVTPGDLGMGRKRPMLPTPPQRKETPAKRSPESVLQEAMAKLEMSSVSPSPRARRKKEAPKAVKTKEVSLEKGPLPVQMKTSVETAQKVSGKTLSFVPSDMRTAILYSVVLGPPRFRQPWVPMKPGEVSRI